MLENGLEHDVMPNDVYVRVSLPLPLHQERIFDVQYGLRPILGLFERDLGVVLGMSWVVGLP